MEDLIQHNIHVWINIFLNVIHDIKDNRKLGFYELGFCRYHCHFHESHLRLLDIVCDAPQRPGFPHSVATTFLEATTMHARACIRKPTHNHKITKLMNHIEALTTHIEPTKEGARVEEGVVNGGRKEGFKKNATRHPTTTTSNFKDTHINTLQKFESKANSRTLLAKKKVGEGSNQINRRKARLQAQYNSKNLIA